eukprot:gene10225-11319_t
MENIEANVEYTIEENGYESSSSGEFLEELESHVQELIRKHSRAPRDAWESFEGFRHAIDWTEPFIQGILTFHIILLTLVFFTRKNVEIQFLIFILACGIVFFAENINFWAALHWRELTRQNYFDEHGVFMSIMVSMPLLVIAFIQLVNLLTIVSSELITTKRKEIQQKLKAQKKQQEEEEEKNKMKESSSTTPAVATTTEPAAEE